MSKSIRLTKSDRRTIKSVRKSTKGLQAPERAAWARSVNVQQSGSNR